MNSKVLELINLKVKQANNWLYDAEWLEFLAELSAVERKRLELEAKYLPRKLMRMSLASVQLAQSQLADNGLQLAFNGTPTGSGLFCCVAVNDIEIGLLKERMINLLPMPDADGIAWHDLPAATDVKQIKAVNAHTDKEHGSLVFPVPNAPDVLLYVTPEAPKKGPMRYSTEQIGEFLNGGNLPPVVNCEECVTPIDQMHETIMERSIDEISKPQSEPLDMDWCDGCNYRKFECKCITGDGSGEALPELSPAVDITQTCLTVGKQLIDETLEKFLTDELCPHNLQPEDCMFCKVPPVWP